MNRGMFADGLTEWLRGSDTAETEAASLLVAEMIGRIVGYLRGLEEEARKNRT